MKTERLESHAPREIAGHARHSGAALPALAHAIAPGTSYFFLRDEDVEGRVKPGHDGRMIVERPDSVIASVSEAIHVAAKQDGLLRRLRSSQ
jgi:hypothetical protein